jgi:DNA-directed RNA polymerase specialized sigma24 family protein
MTGMPAQPGFWLPRILSEGIERLPLPYRQVLTLFYVQELSYEEIAQVTGLPLGTIKTHLFRARNLLKKDVIARIEAEKPHHDDTTPLVRRKAAGAA